jgi:hypothetical protein
MDSVNLRRASDRHGCHHYQNFVRISEHFQTIQGIFMTLPTREFNFDFISAEQITALKRLVHISFVTMNSPYQEEKVVCKSNVIFL